MIDPEVAYVSQTPEESWRITGSRITLDSIVHGYWEGQSPEAIAEDFPSLSLEQVYGAIAFYLRHRQEIDRYMEAQEARWEQIRQKSEAENVFLLSRLRAHREESLAKDGSP